MSGRCGAGWLRRVDTLTPVRLSRSIYPPRGVGRYDLKVPDIAAEVLDKTRSRIRSYRGGRTDWNLWLSLKNLVEQAVRDYEHRALVELLQNAHDAHEVADRHGRVLVRLDQDEGEHGVLYVANCGQPFTRSNFDAITDIARSDKRPEEGIGNKGIGFKSVLQLTHAPQIYSVADAAASRSFDGYCFTFADADALLDVLDGDADLVSDIERDIFHLCLPVPLTAVPAQVGALAADGYVTVVRLPLKSEEARGDVVQQIETLVEGPPALLFLRRISLLMIEQRHGGEFDRHELPRVEKPFGTVRDVSLTTVNLGEAGIFLLADKLVGSAAFMAAIERSVAGDHISQGWRDWSGEARVGVALPLDGDLDVGRLFTHLPMGERAISPLLAHVNAPFFAKLARVDLEETVPLNDFLLDEVAGLSTDVLLACSRGEIKLSPTVCADLISWDAHMSGRLMRAFDKAGFEIGATPVVPVVAKSRSWGALDEAYLWEDRGRTVLTAARLTKSAGVAIVHLSIVGARADRLEHTARRLAGRPLRPRDEDVACWSEQIAQALASRPFDAEVWGHFYDELACCLRSAGVLQRRRILINDAGRLQRCNTTDSDARGPVAFFSPQVDTDLLDLRLPRKLRRRVFFVASRVEWTSRLGTVTSKRPGRRMLEDAGLVTEYRAADLLPLVGRALRARPDPELAGQILAWTQRFAQSREEPPWRDIRDMGLLVPVQDGNWIPADEALFSAAWGGETSAILEDLLMRGGDISEDLAALRARLLVGPDDESFRDRPAANWRSFLVELNVREGLWPDPVPGSLLSRDGHVFESGMLIAPPSLPSASRQVWTSIVRQRPPTGLRPYTKYVSIGPLFRLPGQDDHERMPDAVKRLYARLIAVGLSCWKDEMLSVRVHRYNDKSDRFSLPSPAAAFLEMDPWVPITRPRERSVWTFVKAEEAWTHSDDHAPPFAPLIPPVIRRVLDTSEFAAKRARALGVRWWEDQATAGSRVQLLGLLLRDAEVPDTGLAQFRRAYEDAWADCAQARISPFPTGTAAELVVSRSSQLEVLTLGADASDDGAQSIYVEDDIDARQTVQLLEQRMAPLLRLRHAHGAKVAVLLEEQFGTQIRRVSQVSVSVRVDGRDFRAGVEGELLVTANREFLLDVLAAVMDLRASRFRRQGAEFLRRKCALARRVQLVRAITLESYVDGLAESVTTSRARWLVVPHDDAPTILLESGPEDDERLLIQRSAAGLMELLGLPELGDTLQITLINLANAGWGPDTSPGADAIAEALDEDPERVREITRAIRQPLDILLPVLVPLLAVLDSDAAHHMLAEEDAPASIDELSQWLAAQAPQVNAAALLAAASRSDLNTARLELRIALPALNAAIAGLGPPYRPLRNDEGIAQEFRHYVAVHRREILDALRAGYLQAFRAGAPLASYVQRRDLATLPPNPGWPDECLQVEPDLMRDWVNQWLADAGAPRLGEALKLRPVDELQEINRTTLLGQLERAANLIRAWEAAHNRPVSGLPGQPLQLAGKPATAVCSTSKLSTTKRPSHGCSVSKHGPATCRSPCRPKTSACPMPRSTARNVHTSRNDVGDKTSAAESASMALTCRQRKRITNRSSLPCAAASPTSSSPRPVPRRCRHSTDLAAQPLAVAAAGSQLPDAPNCRRYRRRP